jgi:hypothetical protein
MDSRKMPGIQDFEDMRRSGYVHADKTGMNMP